MHSRMALQGLVVFLLAVPAAGVCADEWYESYEKGRVALSQNQFAEAAQYLTDAIEQKPESKANARTYGMVFIDYFPYLYRGIARARLGQAGLAKQDFETEDRAGEVYEAERDTRAGPLLRQQLEGLKSVAANKEEPQPVSSPPESATDDASLVVKAPDTRIAAQTAEDTLFAQAVEDLRRGQMLSAKRAFANLQRRRRTFPGFNTHIQTIQAQEREIRRGIKAYLSGQYQKAVDVLTPVAERAMDVPDVHAFLGSSYAALYFLSGEDATSLRDRAREAFGRARSADTAFRLDSSLVSPRIREVYESVPQP